MGPVDIVGLDYVSNVPCNPSFDDWKLRPESGGYTVSCTNGIVSIGCMNYIPAWLRDTVKNELAVLDPNNLDGIAFVHAYNPKDPFIPFAVSDLQKILSLLS